MSAPARRRASWALADQGLSSITNFALSVAVARTTSAAGFGAFGLAMSIYLLALGFVRSVVAEPLLVRAPTAQPDEQRRLGDAALGAGLAIGLLIGAATAAGAAVASGTLRTTLVALAAGMPGLLVQDVARHRALALGCPERAARLDALWAIVMIPTVGAVLAAGVGGPGTLTAAWAMAAAAAAAPAIVGAGMIRPRLRAWMREQRALVPAFTAEFAARNASRHLTTLLIGGTIGLRAVGAVRAAQVITGPVTTVLFGLGTAAIPEAARAHAEAPGRLVPRLRVLSISLSCAALAVGLAPLALPDDIGVALLGASWAPGRSVLVPQAVLLASMGATTGAVAGLRVLRATRGSLAARSASALGGLLGGVTGAALGGAEGALWGMAGANWLAVVGWWLALLHAANATIGGPAAPHQVPGARPQASATVAGSAITTSAGIASTAVSRSAKQ